METEARAAALAEHESAVAGCLACPLCESRSQVVVGGGRRDAELMLVGETPGFHDDRLGVPFAGQEADLVERLLVGIGLTRDDVYCTTVLKCRPAGNREPLPEEIAACETHLYRQLELVRPRVVAALGTVPTQLLTGRRQGVTEVNGIPQRHVLAGAEVTVLPLYNPAVALYAPERLAQLEVDFARIPALLGRAVPHPDPAPVAVASPVVAGAVEQLGLF